MQRTPGLSFPVAKDLGEIRTESQDNATRTTRVKQSTILFEKLDTHYPCSRAVNTGSVYRAPVNTGREYGPCSRVVCIELNFAKCSPI